MIYQLDRSCLGHRLNIYMQVNIDKQHFHNLKYLQVLYSIRNRSCCGHPSCDMRQISGICPYGRSIMASNHTRDVNSKIYSLIRPNESLSVNWVLRTLYAHQSSVSHLHKTFTAPRNDNLRLVLRLFPPIRLWSRRERGRQRP